MGRAHGRSVPSPARSASTSLTRRGGLFGIAFPHLAALSISTGVHVHNLDRLGLPLVLVVVSVAGVGVGSLVTELHRIPRSLPSPAPPELPG